MHPRRRRFARVATVAALVALAGCSEDLPTRPGPAPAPEAPRRAVEPYTGLIRIGVVPSASSVKVGATASYEVREKETNALLLTGAAGEVVTVSWTSSASVTTESRRLQVTCTGSTAERDRRLADGAAAGFPTAAEWVSTAACWRVYVGERPLPIDTAAERVYKDKVIAAGQATSDAFWRTVTLTQSLPRYVVTRGNGTQVLAANPPRVVPSTGQVLIAGQKYRGTAEVQLNSSQSLLAGINELPMEQYLYGVVPKELGPVTYPEVEAQRAQAVAARTYAHANLGKRWSDGYDLGATVSDQVYGGYSAEHSVSTAAVNHTAGLVATYGGALIDALFHATSGGHTAHSEDIFSGTLAYLRGVWDYPAGAELSSTSALLADLRDPTSTTSYEAWHHWHRWNFTWTMSQISSVIGAYAGRPVGNVLAINVLSRSPTGRVTKIEYVTEEGTFYDTKGRIRSSLKYIDPATGKATLLPSTLFVIDRLVDASGQTTGYKVYGGGNGHGIGLSQTGAVGMARAGHTYPQILKKYYTGIAIEQKVGTRS
ncbi:MAG TPA: SpoIID/LytB domain-containing protein [Longimicrobiaceae bacterium]|nr:SpoIID/LytB domain-containing protein [Longimicrobiaceae bacterium]